MRRASIALLLALAGCPEKAAPPAPPPPAPKPTPSVPDAGVPEPTHLRPAPAGGEVKALSDGTLALLGHTEVILAVAFDASGRRVATGGLDRSVRVWDLDAKKLLWAYGPTEEAVTSIAFDPKGQRVAAGERSFQVRLLDATDGGLVEQIPHPDAVNSVAFSPDGQWLAVAGSGGNAGVFPTTGAGKPKCDMRGRTAAFTDSGKYVVTASGSGLLVVTSFPACKKVKETSTAPHLPFAAPSAKASLVGTRNGAESQVLLWDALGGRMLGKLEGQSAGVTSLQLSADGKRALVGSEDHHVRLYDVDKREVLKTIETGALPFAAMSPDAKWAVIADGVEARVVSLAP